MTPSFRTLFNEMFLRLWWLENYARVCHWRCDDYSVHSLLEAYSEKLHPLLDDFVEVYLGLTGEILEGGHLSLVVDEEGFPNIDKKVFRLTIPVGDGLDEIIENINQEFSAVKSHAAVIAECYDSTSPLLEIVSDIEKSTYILLNHLKMV